MKLYHGDCLEEMSKIPDDSIDMVMCDPPYGTTACRWDAVIPFAPMWAHLKRITKKRAAIVLTGSEPFASMLRVSNLKMYKYDWVLRKTNATGYLDTKIRPLNNVETASVFCAGAHVYNPQMVKGSSHKRNSPSSNAAVYSDASNRKQTTSDMYYPKRIIKFTRPRSFLHPTQKPVALMEYMIRTYTNPGATVLDFTMGSGTTGVACKNLDRDFIGIEQDPEYFELARNRITNHSKVTRLAKQNPAQLELLTN